jgi:tetratricopeptide (TPR) repeat protein
MLPAVRGIAFGLLLAMGCTRPAAPSAPVVVPVATPASRPIAFVEDDYASALSEARAAGVPLFIDAWATWCHTCLSMRAYVFADPGLQRLSSRFVWLSLDTERETNAPAVTRLGVVSLPTLFVIDSRTEDVVLSWTGSLTATELARLLDGVSGSPDASTSGEAAASLLRGHRARAARDLDAAIAHYRAALAAAPAHGPDRDEAADALVACLSEAKRSPECLETAALEAPGMSPGTALADVLRAGIQCAPPEGSPQGPERASLVSLVALGEHVVRDPAQPILADDRSDLYDNVVEALRALGRPDEARRLAQAWTTFLEDQASRAATPAARAVFDAHRLLAYKALGEPQRAVPMLEQSEREFPGDYNPPARLAAALLEMKRYDLALVAVERSLALAYGPRKLRLWSLEADIRVARGDAEGARHALRTALAFAERVPLTSGYPRLRDALARRLAELR